MAQTLGIDAGNFETKVCGSFGTHKFNSTLGEYRERNLGEGINHGPDDMVWEYQGEKGFAGTLAQFESEFKRSVKGSTKAHEDAKLRVLLAVHRYGGTETEFNLIVGQPIDSHVPEEKAKIKEMLEGDHEMTVNGKFKRFTISRVEVAAEGSAANLADPKKGLVRIIDIGSGTINFATLYDLRYVDKDSFTEKFGMETVKSKDWGAMAKAIHARTTDKWDKNDLVRVVGGGASTLFPHLKEYFNNIELLQPKLRVGDGISVVEPVYANAVAFHEIGRKVYGEK